MARNRLISAPSGPRTRRAVMTLAAAVAVAAFVTGCAAPPPEVTGDDPELVLGRDVFARNCASCHGSAGGGGVGSQLSEGVVIEAFPTIEAQIAMVAEGRNNMPAFGDRLTEEEQRAVARYIREIL
ncbi:MAG: c-type cytochrome [Actinomycetota bacterium]